MQSANSGGGIISRLPIDIIAVVRGTLLGAGFALLGAVLLSVVITLAELDPIPTYLYAFHYVCIALGAALAARNTKRLGWLHGGLVGVLYLLFIAWLFPPGFHLVASASANWLPGILYSFAAGALGGVIGVNA